MTALFRTAPLGDPRPGQKPLLRLHVTAEGQWWMEASGARAYIRHWCRFETSREAIEDIACEWEELG